MCCLRLAFVEQYFLQQSHEYFSNSFVMMILLFCHICDKYFCHDGIFIYVQLGHFWSYTLFHTGHKNKSCLWSYQYSVAEYCVYIFFSILVQDVLCWFLQMTCHRQDMNLLCHYVQSSYVFLNLLLSWTPCHKHHNFMCISMLS